MTYELTRVLSKETLRQVIDTIVKQVDDGDTNAAEAFIFGKFMEEMGKMLKDAIKEDAIVEIEKYAQENKGGVVLYGAKITHKSGKRNYNFDHIPEIVAKQEELKELQDAAKDAAKTAEKGNTLVIEGDGTVVAPAQVKYSTDTIEIKFQ